MKNVPDNIFFTRLSVLQASQNSLYRKAKLKIELAIPPMLKASA